MSEQKKATPYVMQLGEGFVKVNVETDGTVAGTKVTDAASGRLIPVSHLKMEMDFSGRRDIGMLDLELLGAVSIANAHPTKQEYMLLAGCPNPECEYHGRGIIQQNQQQEADKLPEDLRELYSRLLGMQKAVHQATLSIWEACWEREADNPRGEFVQARKVRFRILKAMEIAAEIYPEMIAIAPEFLGVRDEQHDQPNKAEDA